MNPVTVTRRKPRARAGSRPAPRAASGNGNGKPHAAASSPAAPPAMPPSLGDELKPPFRRLRSYAFDPSISLNTETAPINEIVLRVAWEPPTAPADGSAAALEAGPVGEYLEVVDFDPASGCYYAPVDLNHPLLLAQDGLPPSEGNPQFHQQMVYAVAMTTIRNFERALGRRVLWADRPIPQLGAAPSRAYEREFTRRLRIYPHALREANAYYSPEKRALLFGYFPAAGSQPKSQIPGGTVFTCLSHDIVAHETTHALLDGIHGRFVESTGADGPAFHEAFADIVALFQHFSFPEVLRHQIASRRGDLASQSLLGELAQQFGQAIGQRGALRDALGGTDEKGEWKPRVPDPDLLMELTEAHARGSILVAAVFSAFLTIYRGRVADLFRLATQGTGVLPPGAIHPDLVNRLAQEAAKSAQHVLNMCVRALDYCPPVDIRFGDYLRALITADSDLVPDDDMNYRVAFIEAFRGWGIYPRNVRALSVDSLRWRRARPDADVTPIEVLTRDLRSQFLNEFLRDVANPRTSREAIYERSRDLSRFLHTLFVDMKRADYRALEAVTGLVLRERPGFQGMKAEGGWYPFEVHAVRVAQRVGPDGDALNQLVIVLNQRRWLPVDPAANGPDDPHFRFRGGCTVLLDLDTFALRYAIAKPVDSEDRVRRQRAWLSGSDEESLRATYFGRRGQSAPGDPAGPRDAEEPFAMLHRGA